jgi:hypothetical protein
LGASIVDVLPFRRLQARYPLGQDDGLRRFQRGDRDIAAVCGGVNVLYGSSGVGVTATGDQFWDQSKLGVEGAPEEFDWFGDALASGDFDGDS